jgi:hypothetical protein
VKLTRLVNLTPHDPLNIWAGDKVVLSMSAAGPPARCREIAIDVEPLVVGGVEVPVVKMVYAEVSGLPDPVPGVAFVVSLLVIQAEPGREDLFHPASLRRDSAGAIVGCERLAHG